MERYNFTAVEKKWQSYWEEHKTFKVELDPNKKKTYLLVEFPFPSGEGLHVGHPRSYTALDIIARKRRMQGENVLFPMGFDSFGLPTENYAIKHHVHPAEVTEKNIKRYTAQLKSIGISFDWDRCVKTSDPDFYKWTQWIFLKLFEHGLAYKASMDINYCPDCKVGLANEEVVGGECERCHAKVIRKEKEQWMLRITRYADRLIDDLHDLDFIDRVKTQQTNWIGRSHGASILFPIKDTPEKLEVFTTRPDTIYGATYMVVAPEHPLIKDYSHRIENVEALENYRIEAKKKSDFERTELVKDKTGVEIKGLRAINPISGEEIPIFISDYVMMSYGSGAIMAVPAHDSRDYDFAKAFGAPIKEVVSGGNIQEEAYTGQGTMVNSPLIDGLDSDEAIQKMLLFIEERGLGEAKIQYKLRDWVFSRQRFWGEPIPIVNCEDCGLVPLKEEDLPLVLPDIDDFEPGEDGSSPLAKAHHWVNTRCPVCGKPAKREIDTMPQWAGSSWYFLRYLDPYNDQALASKEAIDYWMPVDWYNGGMEHTTLHLLYSRFWYKFLYDIGVVPESEPYKRRTSHGFILGEDAQKMSKSRGNVLNPDDVIDNYGADTLRAYEMFIGDFEKTAIWSVQGVGGPKKFLDRLWNAFDKVNLEKKGYSKDLEVLMHQTIEKVGHDYEALKANTAIAQMMTLMNEFSKRDEITRDEYYTLLQLLNPVAPHITEELNQRMGNETLLYHSSWPSFDPEKTLEDMVEMPVQINGKIRFKIEVPRGLSKEEVQEVVESHDHYRNYVSGEVRKFILVPEKIVNIVL